MKRSGFLASSASLVALSTAPAAAAQAVPGGTHYVERYADFDEAAFDRLVGGPAAIRQLWEAVAFKPAMLNNMKNALNGLQFGFKLSPVGMVLAGHGPSAAYGYSDYVWQKYRIGEFFKIVDAAGQPVTSNIYFPSTSTWRPADDPDDGTGMYQDTSLQTLQQRGVVVLTCHTAVEEQSKALVKGGFAPANTAASDVADDILTHLIPGASVVPAMVAAVAVLQARHHYTYVTLTF
jgi:intracellular sulfur oxidation DsrE/DsrF family protein